MKEADFQQILNRLNNIFMKEAVENVKQKIHFEALRQYEEAEICEEKIKICNLIHEIIKKNLKK
ncbi:MAG TPA: hypothetical protein PLI22_02225 [Caldisericia bacterium]|nr:hypothetical protein [Caldisericia bacterium]